MHGELHLGFWSFVKKGAGALDTFFILRSFTLYQFGMYYLLLSFYGILSDFFHDIFGEVVANDLARLVGAGEEAKAKRLFREYAAFRVALAVIPAAVFFFAAPLIASFLGYGDDTAVALRILAFLFIAEALIGLAALTLKLRLAFQVLAPRATIQKLLQFCILAAFFFSSRLDISTVFWAQLGGAVGAFLFILPAAVRQMSRWRGVPVAREPMFMPVLRAYGKWAVPQSILTDFTGKARPWLIRLFISTEAVGVFGVANTFLSALKDLLPIRTPGSIVPRRIKDARALDRFYRYGTKYFVWLGVLLSAGSAAAVPLVILILFPRFSPAIPIFWVLLASVPFFAFVKPMTFLLVAFRRQKFLFFQQALQTAIAFGLMLVLLPAAGIRGLAIAEVLAAIANVGVRYRYLVREGVIAPFPFRSLYAVDREDRVNARMLLAFVRSTLHFKTRPAPIT